MDKEFCKQQAKEAIQRFREDMAAGTASPTVISGYPIGMSYGGSYGSAAFRSGNLVQKVIDTQTKRES